MELQNIRSSQRFIKLTIFCNCAQNIGVPFLETSARTSTNVEQAFLTMAAEIKNRVGPVGAAGGPSSSQADRINPSSTPIKSHSSGCC